MKQSIAVVSACATITATALLFIPSLHLPFLIPKIGVLFAGAAATAIVISSSKTYSLRDLWTDHRPLAAALVIAAAALVISALASPLRRFSPLPLLMFIATLLFTAALLTLQAERKYLVRCIAICGVITSVIAILQRASIFDPISLSGFAPNLSGRMRAYATFGNPDFVAAYIAMCLPCCITAWQSRTVRVVAVCICAAALFACGSRAGLLSGIVAVAVVLVALGRQLSRRSVFVAAATIAVACASLVYLNGRPIQTALKGRLTIARIAVSGAGVRLLGTGPGTFSYLYPEWIGTFFSRDSHGDLLRFAGYERHAQNDYTELLIESGPIATIALLVAVCLWFRIGLRTARRTPSRHSAAAMGMFAALLIDALFDFPMHRPETLTLAAVAFALPFSPRVSEGRERSRFHVIAAAVVVGAALLVAGYTLCSASRLTAQGQQAESASLHEDAAIFYRSALALNPSDTDANFSLVRALAQAEHYDAALEQSNIAFRWVQEPEIYLLRARIMQAQQRYPEAVEELRDAQHRFPYSQELSTELGGLLRTTHLVK